MFPASLEIPVRGLAGHVTGQNEDVRWLFLLLGEKVRLRASVTFPNKIVGPL
jgi:hypothetical protein